MDDLKRLEADLRAHEGLRGKFDEALKQIKDEGTVASDGEAFVAAAKTLGYEFTITALEQSRAMAEELDMEELGR